MLNALAVGTYVRPHRHEDKHKGEGFIILRGKLALLIFTGAGEIDFGRILSLSPLLLVPLSLSLCLRWLCG